jgi:hypothetical protein
MGIREGISRNRALIAVIAIALIVVSGALILRNRRAEGVMETSSAQAFFSVDDGKSWFLDDVKKIPPFQHDGKPACRAYVFTCDGGKTKWVGYLEQFTPEAKKQLEQAQRGTGPPELPGPLGPTGRQVKRPQTTDWVDSTDAEQVVKITQPTCPHGGAHPVELVLP